MKDFRVRDSRWRVSSKTKVHGGETAATALQLAPSGCIYRVPRTSSALEVKVDLGSLRISHRASQVAFGSHALASSWVALNLCGTNETEHNTRYQGLVAHAACYLGARSREEGIAQFEARFRENARPGNMRS